MAAVERLIDLLNDPATVELMVNSDGSVYRELARGGLERAPIETDPDEAQAFVDELTGRRQSFGPRRAFGDLTAEDGSRVHVLAPPIVGGGLCVTVRKRPKQRMALGDLVDRRMLSEACGQFLRFSVEARRNILVVGGTSSGKTTLLNALCALIDARERVLVLEDTAELTLPQAHVISMKTRTHDVDGLPDITLRELVSNTLRMRPDRIVVGECRGPEAADLLQAMNVGQAGVMSTVHANSPREAILRLETLVLSGGSDLPLIAVRSSIATAVHIIVFAARLPDGARQVLKVSEITGMELDNVSMSDLFVHDPRSQLLNPTGMIPKFYDPLREAGFEPPLDFFQT